MGLDESYLTRLATGGEDISLMRLFHYFPPEAHGHVAPGASRTGSSPHTDWHLLTVILQDGTGGLQVRRPRYPYDWIDVPPVEGEVIIILGDYLAAISGGRFVAPVHRVLLPPNPLERYSLTYFRYPGCAATVPAKPARRAEALARRRAKERARYPDAATGTFNTLVAPAQARRGRGPLPAVTTRPWAALLVDKWNGVAANKADDG